MLCATVHEQEMQLSAITAQRDDAITANDCLLKRIEEMSTDLQQTIASLEAELKEKTAKLENVLHALSSVYRNRPRPHLYP